MAQPSAEKLEHTGPAKKEREHSVPQRRPEPPFAKKKRNRAVCLDRAPDRDGKRVNVSKSRTLARKREIRARAWRGKGGLHGEGRRVSRKRGRSSKKSLPRESRRKHERVNGRKSSPAQSAESWFHS